MKKQIKSKKQINYYKLLFKTIFISLVVLGIIYIVLLTAYVITLHKLYNFWQEIYVPTNITNQTENVTEISVIETKTDKKVTKEQSADVSKTIEVETTRSADIRLDDRELLARLLYTEARGESIECQRAVVSVVVNRLNSGYWGSTYKSVIEAQGQFDLGRKLENVTPNQTQYEVVDYVLNNGITIPSDVIYFRAGYYHSWATDYCQIDNTYFSK